MPGNPLTKGGSPVAIPDILKGSGKGGSGVPVLDPVSQGIGTVFDAFGNVVSIQSDAFSQFTSVQTQAFGDALKYQQEVFGSVLKFQQDQTSKLFDMAMTSQEALVSGVEALQKQQEDAFRTVSGAAGGVVNAAGDIQQILIIGALAVGGAFLFTQLRSGNQQTGDTETE